MPLTLIYLHQVRGIPLAITGVLFTAAAVMGLVTVPVSGVLLDRAGARPVLAAVIAGQALAATGLVWAHSAATALPVMLVQGRRSGHCSQRSTRCWPGSTAIRSSSSGRSR